MTWIDDGFKWNPREYSNLTTVHESSDLIWTPELNHVNG